MGATFSEMITMPLFLGGFAFVFIAQDSQSGQDFALKVTKTLPSICFVTPKLLNLQRLIAADSDAVKCIIQEVTLLVRETKLFPFQLYHSAFIYLFLEKAKTV